MIYKSYISGLKWWGLKKALFQAANYFDLIIRFTDIDKGWIRETIFFEVEGDKENIEQFEKALQKEIDEFNKD